MSSREVIIAIIAVVAIGFFASIFLLGESGLDEFTIMSNDQIAELVIPKTALPDNVTIEDISVTRISSSQFGDESLIAYELEPDGLEFTEEVFLKFQLDEGDDSVPLVFISTSNGIDLVNNTKSEVNLKTEKQNITIQLTHFSQIWISSAQDPYQIKASVRDTPCGEPILTNATFTLYKDNFVIMNVPSGITVWKFLEPSVKIKGSWENLNPMISPLSKIHGKPQFTDVSVGETFTVKDNTFRCSEPGLKTTLVYTLEVHVREMQKFFYASDEDYLAGNGTALGTEKYFSQIRILTPAFNCLSEPVGNDPLTDSDVPVEDTDEPVTDPIVEPEVELSIKRIEDEDLPGIVTNKEFFVDIKARPGANGTVTLSGPSIQPIIKTIIIDESGQARIKFDVIHYGKYTAVVQIDGFSVEKSLYA